MAKCRVYANGKSVEIADDVSSVMELWRIDPRILLEKIKNYAGISGVEFKGVNIYGRYSDGRNQLVIGYLVKDPSEHEHRVFIVCAENPDELYAKTRVEKSNWRDYELYALYKATILDNYVNMEGVKIFDEAFQEVIELVNDLIDANPFLSCKEKEKYYERLKELSVRSAFRFALDHIAFPLANAVLYDLVGGNFVACFMQLRLILEALIKSLAVDYKNKFKDISVESIEEWEKYTRGSFRNIVESLCNHSLLNTDACRDAIDIWNNLSEEWVHLRGYASKVKERVREGKRPAVPFYLWVMPTDIDSELEPELHDLHKYVCKLRKLLCKAHNTWLDLVKKYDAELVEKCYKPCEVGEECEYQDPVQSPL